MGKVVKTHSDAKKANGIRASEIIFLVEEAPEGGFIAHALGVPIFTEADKLEDLSMQIRDAVRCHYPSKAERPKVIRLHFIREELIAV